MTTIETPTATTEAEPTVESFAERLFLSVLGAQEVQAVYLGLELGWYAALAEHGPLTSVELAARTGSAERYAREWLEHQAVCGYLSVDRHDTPATERRYTLPAAHAEVLTEVESLAYVAPLARFVAAAGHSLDRVAEAYRTGGGVRWGEMGSAVREAQAAANRPLFIRQLGRELLPQVPDLHARLAAGARVADIGCGGGWSAVAIAQAYPATQVVGFDLDEPSVEMARRHAAQAGVDDRVSFWVADAADVEGTFDAVFAFECIHDLPDPVSVLATMRRLAGSGGAVVVMDERVAETFTAPGDHVERLMYGYSITCCLPDGLAHQPSAGTGTVMRPATLIDYAVRAGFTGVEVLPIENDFFRFYRLQP